MSGQARSASSVTGELSTRTALLRAGERLFAELGIGPTSTRAILREAGQRNESALQYHFGGREGLVDALYAERGAQVGEERERMLAELDASGDTQDVRRLCAVAVLPPVRIGEAGSGIRALLEGCGSACLLAQRCAPRQRDPLYGGIGGGGGGAHSGETPDPQDARGPTLRPDASHGCPRAFAACAVRRQLRRTRRGSVLRDTARCDGGRSRRAGLVRCRT